MSTALAPRRVAPVATPSVLENLEPVFLLAADRCTMRTFPPLSQIEQARVELVRAIEARPPAAEVRKNIARLVLAYPQHLRAESPEIFIAALESEAGGYPPDVLALACRSLLRTCKFVPSVAELVEACEQAMEPRRRLLRGADTLKAHAQAHERDRIERERVEAQRVAFRETALAGIRQHFGDAVPSWLTIERSYRGSVECGASGRILAEQEAAGGDGGAFVHVRRAALYGLALGLEHSPLPGYRRLLPADLLALASHLCRDEDKVAAELIEATSPASPREEGGEPPSRLVINAVMKRALTLSATNRGARAEGLRVPEVDPWGQP